MDGSRDENQASLLELEMELIGLRHRWEEAQASGLSEVERREVLEQYIRGQARVHGRISEAQFREVFPEAV